MLLTIFVNHVPGNLLEHLTYRNLGLSDGAEAFVFIAGVSIALVYYHRLDDGCLRAVLVRFLRRAFHLYRVHLALTFAAVAVFAAAYVASEAADLIEANGRSVVFNDTARGITGVLLLGHQLGYFNILPLYVVLMLWAPFALWLVRLHLPAALGVSLLIYLAARVGGLSLPSWPEPGSWFFNPFAWQLLFTLGVAAGVIWRDGSVPHVRPLYVGALGILGVSAIIATNGLGLAPGLWDWAYARLDLLKHDLATIRLLHFLALAYVLTQVPIAPLLSRTVVGQELQRLGRHGLAIFAAGSVLSAVGQVAMTLGQERYGIGPEIVGVVFTLAGATCLFLLARYFEWTTDRTAARPRLAAPGLQPVPVRASARRPSRFVSPAE